MNELQIQAMERKLQEMQEQLKAMREEKEKKDTGFPAMLPDEGKYFLSNDRFTPEHMDWTTLSAKEDDDQNVFPSQQIAEAYADAFRVMLELRRCEGAGHYYEEYGDFYGWSICQWGSNPLDWYPKGCHEMFAFFPPFPTEELAQAAIDNVGKERIIAAMQLLANVKD